MQGRRVMGIGFIIGSKGHRVKGKYGVKGPEGCRLLSFLRPSISHPCTPVFSPLAT